MCCCVVCLHWCSGLYVAHFFECFAGRYGFACVDVEAAELCFGRTGHDCFNYLRDVENGAIVFWELYIFREEPVAADAAAG